MVRPKKNRLISYMPDVTYFKPPGIPLRFLDEVCITFEETEAIRLKDSEGFDQITCAEKMDISRQTFQRVLQAAREKIAEALLNGKAIRIEGGHFDFDVRRFRCRNGHEWDMKIKASEKGDSIICPICKDSEIIPIEGTGPGHGRGRGRRGRWGNWPEKQGQQGGTS